MRLRAPQPVVASRARELTSDRASRRQCAFINCRDGDVVRDIDAEQLIVRRQILGVDLEMDHHLEQCGSRVIGEIDDTPAARMPAARCMEAAFAG